MRSVDLITSRIIAAPHAFTSRIGGVSLAPFDSLNTSFAVRDDPANVHHNLQTIGRTFGFSPAQLMTLEQVHGDEIVHVTKILRSEAADGAPPKGDALVSDNAHVFIGVRTADCIPLLIEGAEHDLVAAVHAGWRGVMNEIAAKTVFALVQLGARACDLRMAVGPCIRSCCYEVDIALASQFASAFGNDVVKATVDGEKPHLDLVHALLVSLARSGVERSNIDVVDICTSCDSRFFSHRRDRGHTGRQLALISPRRRSNSIAVA